VRSPGLSVVVGGLLALSACAGLDGLTGGGSSGNPDPVTPPIVRPDGGQVEGDGGGLPSSDASGDAAPGPTCDRAGPFVDVVPVSGLPSGVGSPVLSADEREIYFTVSVGDGGSPDLRRATRSSAGVAFEPPSDVFPLHLYDEKPFSLAGNGLALYGAVQGSLRVARRASPTGIFGSLDPLNGFSAGDVYVWVNEDQTVAYTIRRAFGGFGDDEIFRSTAGTPGNFGGAVDQALSQKGVDYAAVVVSDDELTAYLTRKSNGSTSSVYASTRGAKTAPWGAPTLVSEVNTSGADELTWLSRDGCVAYGTRSVGGPAGGRQAFRAAKRKVQ
jgi:hypothetical protein